MNRQNDIATALSKLPTDVLVELMNLYQKSSLAMSKDDNTAETFRICNIPDDVKREIKDYERMGNSRIAEHSKKWVSTIKLLPQSTSPRQVLNAEFLAHVDQVWSKNISGLESIKERLKTHFVEYLQTGTTRPIILAGSPGCGKTRVAKTIGEILQRPVHIANAVQIATGNGLTGHSNTYIGAMPGEVVEGMVRTRSGDYVFVIDEADKAHMIADRSGNFQNELLALTSDETAMLFKDTFIGFPIDASHLFIIMTANELDDLSAPLKSRCDIIEFPEPDRQTIEAILLDHTIPMLFEKLRCKDMITVDNSAVSHLADILFPKCKDVRKYQSIVEATINHAFLQSFTQGRMIVIDPEMITPFANSLSFKQEVRIGF